MSAEAEAQQGQSEGQEETKQKEFPKWTNADLWADVGVSTPQPQKKNILQLTEIKQQLQSHQEKRDREREEQRKRNEEFEQKRQQEEDGAQEERSSAVISQRPKPPRTSSVTVDSDNEAPDELVALEDFVQVPQTPRSDGPNSRAARRAESAPWARKEGYSKVSSNPLLQLHEEILDFCAYVCPSQDEQKKRHNLIEKIRNTCQSIWPDSQLFVFGSMATGLYLPGSDIDMVLFGAEGQNHMRKLARRLKKRLEPAFLEVIPGARIPIIKFTDAETNLQVDICFDQHSGLESAQYIVNSMRRMPALRPLTLVLKCFLTCRDLNEPFKGGVGSFMLQLMIISHLQLFGAREGELWKEVDERVNLGCLLLSFFRRYGIELNYTSVGISVRKSGSLFDKRGKGFLKPDRPYLLSIENPLVPELDVGVSSYGVGKVRRAFVFAYHQLLRPFRANSLSGPLFQDAPQKKSRRRVLLGSGGRPSKRQKLSSGQAADAGGGGDAEEEEVEEDLVAQEEAYYRELGLNRGVEEAPTLLSRILSMPYMD